MARADTILIQVNCYVGEPKPVRLSIGATHVIARAAPAGVIMNRSQPGALRNQTTPGLVDPP